MRIDNANVNGGYGRSIASVDQSKGVDQLQRSQRYGAGGDAPLDNVELSDLAQQVSDLSEHELSTRTAEIDRLRADYQAGTYKPDVSAISNKLVDSALAPNPLA